MCETATCLRLGKRQGYRGSVHQQGHADYAWAVAPAQTSGLQTAISSKARRHLAAKATQAAGKPNRPTHDGQESVAHGVVVSAVFARPCGLLTRLQELVHAYSRTRCRFERVLLFEGRSRAKRMRCTLALPASQRDVQ